MSSTDSMSGFFTQPRGNGGQQSEDSMSSTQLRFQQMTQGLGMGSGASAGINGTPDQQSADSMSSTQLRYAQMGQSMGMGSGASAGTTGMTGQQSTDSMSSTQLRYAQMGQGMGMGTGAGTGTSMGTTGATQQQSTIPSMPGMGPMSPQGAQVDVDALRAVERPSLPGVPEPALPELLQLSLQENLARNLGEFVVIEFLIGTNMIEKKQGILYNVGVSFVTLYEENTKTFVICDFYSIKFVTFYLPGQRPPQATGQQMTSGSQGMRMQNR